MVAYGLQMYYYCFEKLLQRAQKVNYGVSAVYGGVVSDTYAAKDPSACFLTWRIDDKVDHSLRRDSRIAGQEDLSLGEWFRIKLLKTV